MELTLAGAGPFGGSMLAALGADVIKLDRPSGDTSLEVPPKLRGLAHLYLAVNGSVRSMVADLKDSHDAALVRRLIGQSDVFLQNVRAGVAARLGLGPADLLKLQPGIVAASISGYGLAGPLAHDACNDPTMQAFSGFASLNGRPGDPPELYRTYAHLDVTAASYTVLGTVLGLLRRKRFGVGSSVGVSLLSGALGVAGTKVAALRATGERPALLGSAAADTAPHRAFAGSDGHWFTVGVVRPEQWPAFCNVIDRAELAADPRFATNRDRVAHRRALESLIEPVLRKRPASDWIGALQAAGVPSGPVYWDNFAELRADSQVVANQFFCQVQTARRGEIWMGAPPWKFERTPGQVRGAPDPDEHGAAIRGWLETLAEPEHQHSSAASDAPPMAGLTVIEIAGGMSGAYAGLLLQNAGASVTKVEGPDGDPLRGYAPRANGTSVTWAYLNAGKHILPAESLDATLLADADALIVDVDERWVDWALIDEARRRNPRLIVCRLSGYGVEGPLANLPQAELVVQGMAGYLASLGVVGEQPIRLGSDVAGLNTGIAAATANAAGLLHDDGQLVDVSALGVLIHLRTITWTAWSSPDEQIGFAYDNARRKRDFGYHSRDRRLYAASGRGTDEHWAHFLIAIGLEEYLAHPVVGAGGHTVLGTAPYSEAWRDLFDRAFSRFSAAEIIELMRTIGGKPAVIHWLDEILAHPQTAAGAALNGAGLPRPIIMRDLAGHTELV